MRLERRFPIGNSAISPTAWRALLKISRDGSKPWIFGGPDIRDQLFAYGLIRVAGRGWAVTAKGRAHLTALRRVTVGPTEEGPT